LGVDKERLAEILEHLRENISYLETFKVDLPQAFEENKERYFAVKNLLYEAVMDVIRTGQHIISAQQLEKPKSYKDVVRILGENKIIPGQLAERIQKMGGFRVILAHEYNKVTPEKIYELHLRTQDFKDFIYHITKFLESLEN
jgi:uncharacterized protein YutE (UPF0331/DUF86 family)